MTTITIGTQSSLNWKSLSISLLQISAFAALTAVCAQVRIYLPGTPVPITLQSLAVILSGAILGSRKGALSQIALILAGCAGFSVFSVAGPSYLALMGPTGGYILGFILAAFITGAIVEAKPRLGFLNLTGLLFVASLFIFVPGVLWLKNFTGQSLTLAIQMGFIPFLLGDVIKTLIAAIFLSGLQKIRLN